MNTAALRAGLSVKRCALMFGGRSRSSFFSGLGTFIVYSTWAAFQGAHYYFGNYVSPFYSPEIFGNSPHAGLDQSPAWWPAWLLFSPALFILWAPGGFRLTCYYYRGAYYKAFWADPPACTVGRTAQDLSRRAFVPADHAERASLLSLCGADLHRDSRLSTSGKRCGSRIQATADLLSELASARSCWRSMFTCLAVTPSAAIRCAI